MSHDYLRLYLCFFAAIPSSIQICKFLTAYPLRLSNLSTSTVFRLR